MSTIRWESEERGRDGRREKGRWGDGESKGERAIVLESLGHYLSEIEK